MAAEDDEEEEKQDEGMSAKSPLSFWDEPKADNDDHKAPATKKRKTGPTSSAKVTTNQISKDEDEDEEEEEEEGGAGVEDEDGDLEEDDEEDDAEADGDEDDAAEATAKSAGPTAAAKKNVGGAVPKEASLEEVEDDEDES